MHACVNAGKQPHEHQSVERFELDPYRASENHHEKNQPADGQHDRSAPEEKPAELFELARLPCRSDIQPAADKGRHKHRSCCASSHPHHQAIAEFSRRSNHRLQPLRPREAVKQLFACFGKQVGKQGSASEKQEIQALQEKWSHELWSATISESGYSHFSNFFPTQNWRAKFLSNIYLPTKQF